MRAVRFVIFTPFTVHRSPSTVHSPLRSSIFLGIASLGVLAFACAPRSRSEQQAATRAARAPRDARERGADPAPTSPRIESALDVTPDDRGVRFEFVVTNTGGGKADMNFASGQTHEIVVLDTLGREVWRWSKGRMFTRLLQNKVLRGSDTIAFGERWKGAPHGQYVAVAQLVSTNFPVEQRMTFEVR